MVHKLQFCGQADVGFVEGDEEKGEYLMDIDEEDRGFLVEFCHHVRDLSIGASKMDVIPSHSTLSIILGDKILYQR